MSAPTDECHRPALPVGQRSSGLRCSDTLHPRGSPRSSSRTSTPQESSKPTVVETQLHEHHSLIELLNASSRRQALGRQKIAATAAANGGEASRNRNTRTLSITSTGLPGAVAPAAPSQPRCASYPHGARCRGVLVPPDHRVGHHRQDIAIGAFDRHDFQREFVALSAAAFFSYSPSDARQPLSDHSAVRRNRSLKDARDTVANVVLL